MARPTAEPPPVAAVRMLLAATAGRRPHPAPLAIARGGVIALVRETDTTSLDVLQGLRTLAEHAGLDLLDVSPAPVFGRTPRARRVRLVVAATPAVSLSAQRCAAAWNAPVVLPDVFDLDESLRLLLQPEPALTVEFGEGRTCTVLQAAHFAGRMHCSTASGAFAQEARALAVSPIPGGMLACAVSEEAGPIRPLREPLTVRLAAPVLSTVDGVTDLFPAGTHRIGPAQPLYRIVLHNAALKSGDLR
ncbi:MULTISPECIES: hypothetical protein [Lentzea]|uniref:Uncharacterized protein n=2 Tax=Lentzea TaxID=165301 RepID=A0A1W2DBL0_9PSEU|nr:MULTISPECIES: hypothetical protein [Lentzea]MDX8140497.1 hypothetical protein [Lentzea sp. BCCO 10_0061]SMC94909.1 hypothetical protein SAMN05660733_02840 [Lentzea albidocapillata]